jgi:hypothetical protein
MGVGGGGGPGTLSSLPPPFLACEYYAPTRFCRASYEHSVKFSGFSPRYSRFGQSVGRLDGDSSSVESLALARILSGDDSISHTSHDNLSDA